MEGRRWQGYLCEYVQGQETVGGEINGNVCGETESVAHILVDSVLVGAVVVAEVVEVVDWLWEGGYPHVGKLLVMKDQCDRCCGTFH